MGAITGAVIAGAATLGSAYMQSQAAEDAAAAQQAGLDAATGEQRRQFNLIQQQLDPYRQAGTDALQRMQALNAGDFSSFFESPDYQYARSQAQQGIERGAAARGSLYAGGTSVDLAQALSGIASQNYGNFYNRLANLSGAGQNAAAQLGGFGQAAATNIGNLAVQGGQVGGQQAITQGNIWGNALGQLGQIGGQYFGQQPQAGLSPVGPYAGGYQFPTVPSGSPAQSYGVTLPSATGYTAGAAGGIG